MDPCYSVWLFFISFAEEFQILVHFQSFVVQISPNFRLRFQILDYTFRPRFSEKIPKYRISPILSRSGKICKTKSKTLHTSVFCSFFPPPPLCVSEITCRHVGLASAFLLAPQRSPSGYSVVSGEGRKKFEVGRTLNEEKNDAIKIKLYGYIDTLYDIKQNHLVE